MISFLYISLSIKELAEFQVLVEGYVMFSSILFPATFFPPTHQPVFIFSPASNFPSFPYHMESLVKLSSSCWSSFMVAPGPSLEG